MKTGGLAGAWMMIALLSGCTPDAPTNAANQLVNATSFAEKMTGGNEAEPEAQPFSMMDKSEELEFAYSYPAEAAAIPELVRRFDREIRQSKASALKLAREDQASARKEGFPFHGHALETHWSVEGNIPAFLSLLSTGYSFTGGAHGMTGYEALIWDREAKRALGMEAMLSSPADFKAAITEDFCAALDKERAARRGAPVEATDPDDEFTQCIDPMEQVLTPTSRDGKLFDAVKVVIGPYAAGPYAEGSYEISLPVTAAVRATIKDQYQAAFAGG